jgi:hypothetical protein
MLFPYPRPAYNECLDCPDSLPGRLVPDKVSKESVCARPYNERRRRNNEIIIVFIR